MLVCGRQTSGATAWGLHLGTIGELLVQMRLLEYDVQTVSPLKDTGNDLLAVRGQVFRAIQVKTTLGRGAPRELIAFKYRPTISRAFHILALVFMLEHESTALLDQSAIYLLPKEEVTKGRYSKNELERYLLAQEHVIRVAPLIE